MPPIPVDSASVDNVYDLICVGSGFATSFFVAEYPQHAKANARVLILDRGPDLSHSERIAKRKEINLGSFQDTYQNRTPRKPWMFTLGRSGSSNCWVGNTLRMLPSDFRLHSQYGVGSDWPLSYEDLEPYYCEVEDRFGVAGDDAVPYPRSRPHPNPPHQMSVPDRAMAAAYPGLFVNMPVAKPNRPRRETRIPCCSSMSCFACPVDAKFTILNGMSDVYADERVEIRSGARVEQIDHAAGIAQGVQYICDGRVHRVKADLVVLGANGLFNPHLLLRSGLKGPWVGEGLCEQVGVSCTVDLNGMDGFQGSTMHTGLGYMLYDGPHRREQAAALIESNNVVNLRNLRGRFRERYELNFVFEDLPQRNNRVTVDGDDVTRPVVEYHGHSSYTRRGLDSLRQSIDALLSPLPVESYVLSDEVHATEFHIQCTTRMGDSADSSVVDSGCVHHRIRNLVVVGSSVFPTASPANPTLTLSALSMRSARALFGGTKA